MSQKLINLLTNVKVHYLPPNTTSVLQPNILNIKEEY
jgi:hypothetical protein